MFFLLALESSGGFVNPGPIGPYERMIGTTGDFVAILTIVAVITALLSIFVYPYSLWKDKGVFARNVWILSWVLLVSSASVLTVLPHIAKIITQKEEISFLKAYYESKHGNTKE